MSNNKLNKITAWDEDAARHILSRTLFGYTNEDLEFALSATLDDFVDNYLLADQPEPQTPGFWINDTSNENSSERNRELTYWWLHLMLTQGYSFREKMVLFFHNHFVSEISKVNMPQRMYWQNKLFRDYSFGNFKELTKKVTTDPAMLVYLDGIKSTKRDPNENYARELMELFTLGIGNYTEEDIQEAARALTGWRVEGITSYFDEDRFDDGEKTFLGETGNFNYEDIIDIIFNQNAAAVHFCRKLYSEFVYFEPDETYIIQLADIFRSNNYEIKPVLSVMLKSVLFHSDEIRGAKIKSPVEFVLTLIKQLGITNPDYSYLRTTINELKQELFSPPNVAGWKGDKLWISTTTLPERHTFTDAVINGKKSAMKLDPVEYARSFKSPEDAVQLVNDMSKLLIRFPLSEKRTELLLETILEGAEIYDWSTYVENAGARIESLLKVIFRLPEYQLS